MKLPRPDESTVLRAIACLSLATREEIWVEPLEKILASADMDEQVSLFVRAVSSGHIAYKLAHPYSCGACGDREDWLFHWGVFRWLDASGTATLYEAWPDGIEAADARFKDYFSNCEHVAKCYLLNRKAGHGYANSLCGSVIEEVEP